MTRLSARIRRLSLGLSAVLLLGAAGPPPAIQRIELTTRPITAFHMWRTDTQFGPLEFTGGLEISSRAADLGAFSGLRFLNDQGRFLGVADTGFWFSGRVEHDAAGRPTGISDFRMQPITDENGEASMQKQDADAESIAVDDGIALVGFERNHRVSRFRIDDAGMGPALGQVPILIRPRELRANRSLEALARSPEGRLVLVTEKSLDAKGNFLAAVLRGPGKGIFTVRREEPFDVSDAAFLPDGDLLLLERSFSLAGGVGMRLRRLPAASLAKGALADGPVLMQADMSYQIDNMEALDVWRRADGKLIVSIMSDNNHSMLQRNLYLEFILHEDGKAS